MGLEVSGSELVHRNDGFRVTSFSNPHQKENGQFDSGNGVSNPVNFGSHGDETAKANSDSLSNSNFSKDTADEWPAEQKIHSFYFVRYRSCNDLDLKAKIDQVDREIWKKNRQRIQILDKIKAKRLDRAQIIEQLKSLGQEHRQYRAVVDDKINLMKPLMYALGSLRGSNTAGRDKVKVLCSSEEELNELIQRLNYRIQHEVISLSMEKEIIREIKRLEGTRDKVIANAAMRAKIQESLGQKEALQNQVKLIGTDLNEVKKARDFVKSKVRELEDELKAIDGDIASLQLELTSILEKRDKAVETIHKLRQQRDKRNACFFQNRTLLNNAKELAAEKKFQALKELSCEEVEKFMTSWNTNKSFRDDYEKRISASLDIRQLSGDGRMRNPDEKPLLLLQLTKPTEAQTLTKATPKPVQEDPKPTKEQENVAVKNPEKEPKRKQADPKAVLKPRNVEEDEYYVVELPKKETVKRDVVDEAKLKEIRKQEEMEKQKQAMERKKKLAEKAAAKAALRAQKEAEKKQKEITSHKSSLQIFLTTIEREKKLKKKESSSASSSDKNETTDTNIKKFEEKVNKTKASNYLSRGRTKERDAAIAKAYLRRKRSNKYLIWVASAAVVVAANSISASSTEATHLAATLPSTFSTVVPVAKHIDAPLLAAVHEHGTVVSP
ncbi:hypothetical protein V2J09_023697 [Rumex salicifolius]